MIPAIALATAIVAPARAELVERWLRASPAHTLERINTSPAGIAPPANLQTLAQRELTIQGRYRLVTPPAPPPSWWDRVVTFTVDRMRDVWRAMSSRITVNGRATSVTAIALLIAGAVGTVALGVRLFVRRRRLAKRPADDFETAVSPATPQSLFRGACEAAESGRYGDATLALFAATVTQLSRTGAVGRSPSATVGDLRRQLIRHNSALVPEFDAIAQPFIQTAYAQRRIDAEQWLRARDAFQSLRQAARA